MKTLICCLISFCFLISCQKEMSVENGNGSSPTPNPIGDSILISKVIGLDTSSLSGTDTTYKILFTYDNAKRISRIIYLEYPLNVIDTAFYYIDNFVYNNTDTLPKNVYTKIYEPRVIIDTSYLTYQTGTGVLIYDSTISHDLGGVYTTATKYVYTTNTLQELINNYVNSTINNTDNFGYSFIKQNGNITSQIDSSHGELHKFSCTYDDKNNSVTKAYRHWPTYLTFYEVNPAMFLQRHNVTEMNSTREVPSNPTTIITTHYKYSYKYNTKNYPIEIRIQKVSPAYFDDGTNKIKYYYTN